MQGTQVPFLVQADPTCCGQVGPCAAATEPAITGAATTVRSLCTQLEQPLLPAAKKTRAQQRRPHAANQENLEEKKEDLKENGC